MKGEEVRTKETQEKRTKKGIERRHERKRGKKILWRTWLG